MSASRVHVNRRNFLRTLSAGTASCWMPAANLSSKERSARGGVTADVVIVGGGLGGCAAALAALQCGLSVVLTEETDWLGGQLTQQAVPPDEHPWIESHGCTRLYRNLRDGIRDYYRRYYPLTAAARDLPQLNPGNGSVSRLCHEPRVALAVLDTMLAPHRSGGRLTVLLEHRAMDAETAGDIVRRVRVRNLRNGRELDLQVALVPGCHGAGRPAAADRYRVRHRQRIGPRNG